MEGFKIVRNAMDWEHPIWTGILMHYGPGAVQYHPQTWVTPREGYGPLTVFQDWPSTLGYWNTRFRPGARQWRIFQCVYTPSRWDKVWRANSGWMVQVAHMPPGTVLADAVMITVPVEENYL
ncbi:MAG: hypothetical protein C7B46_19965 [Sulfobacillus benefaciens]|uniref:Uncharacterized protein n=1 Tax=Sulfobacillus benefaciens TaxID=453960 RepID=A0A2T2WW03_9FIRM|nr:MAG: hypothetical protein C7B46_19965 [Sulfobacillus benefaciens]